MKEDVILAVKDLSVIYQTDLETVYAVKEFRLRWDEEKALDWSARREPGRLRWHFP